LESDRVTQKNCNESGLYPTRTRVSYIITQFGQGFIRKGAYPDKKLGKKREGRVLNASSRWVCDFLIIVSPISHSQLLIIIMCCVHESVEFSLWWTLLLIFNRYFQGFYAQEACNWRQEEGVEKEEKVMLKMTIFIYLCIYLFI